MDRGAGQAIVHRVTKELDMTKWLNNQGFISEQKDQNTVLGGVSILVEEEKTINKIK